MARAGATWMDITELVKGSMLPALVLCFMCICICVSCSALTEDRFTPRQLLLSDHCLWKLTNMHRKRLGCCEIC